MPNECSETRALCRLLEQCNALTYAAVGGQYGASGWPDRFVAHPAWSGWLEMKTGNRKLSAGQQNVLRRLNEAGVRAYVLRLGNLNVYVEAWDGATLLVHPVPRSGRGAASLLAALGNLKRPMIPGAKILDKFR